MAGFASLLALGLLLPNVPGPTGQALTAVPAITRSLGGVDKAAAAQALGPEKADQLLFPTDWQLPSQLLSVKVLGFGSEFQGYKDRSYDQLRQELKDDPEAVRALKAPKATEAPPSLRTAEGKSFDLDSLLDDAASSRANVEAKEAARAAELRSKRAAAEKEANAKFELQKQMDEAREKSEAARAKKEAREAEESKAQAKAQAAADEKAATRRKAAEEKEARLAAKAAAKQSQDAKPAGPSSPTLSLPKPWNCQRWPCRRRPHRRRTPPRLTQPRPRPRRRRRRRRRRRQRRRRRRRRRQ
eukprot:scaffold19481_cov112-Isochrysis_galbana.AAC.1